MKLLRSARTPVTCTHARASVSGRPAGAAAGGILLADDCQAARMAGDCDDIKLIGCVEAEADLVEMEPQAAARQQRSGVGIGMECGAAGGN